MVSQLVTPHTLIPTPQQMLLGRLALIQQCSPILIPACMLEVFLDTLIPWLCGLHPMLLTTMLLRHLIAPMPLSRQPLLRLTTNLRPQVLIPRQVILPPAQTPTLKLPITNT